MESFNMDSTHTDYTKPFTFPKFLHGEAFDASTVAHSAKKANIAKAIGFGFGIGAVKVLTGIALLPAAVVAGVMTAAEFAASKVTNVWAKRAIFFGTAAVALVATTFTPLAMGAVIAGFGVYAASKVFAYAIARRETKQAEKAHNEIEANRLATYELDKAEDETKFDEGKAKYIAGL